MIPPLHQKRILAFVNHFLISSGSFLSSFASNCETEFIKLERKIQRLEAALTIIESKLDTVPSRVVTGTSHMANSLVEQTKTTSAQQTNIEATNTGNTDAVIADKIEPKNSNDVLHSNDDRYKKFFKMVQFGVPSDAVKMKMITEGVDPSILNKSDAALLTDGE